MSGETYGLCCGRFHNGESSAATAEQLMRSRFSAFAVADSDYLLASWHSSTRPTELDLDDDYRWTRLDIVSTSGGGLFESEGTVEFAAHYRANGRRGVLHERSRFLKENGRWRYLDGTTPAQP